MFRGGKVDRLGLLGDLVGFLGDDEGEEEGEMTAVMVLLDTKDVQAGSAEHQESLRNNWSRLVGLMPSEVNVSSPVPDPSPPLLEVK